jgi:DNA polymerase-3 subunit gamma/tau
VGNSGTVAVIEKTLEKETFPNISLFSGISGTGKSTCAEIAGLRLVCDNPNGVEPCCMCPSCVNNIKALQSTGRGSRMIKYNAGNLSTRVDIQEMIKDIFVFQNTDERVVYIIEEVHSLNELQQTALLEEIDKIPKNVFIIFCTTKANRLLPELRNRSIPFNFNRLSVAEMNVLFEQLVLRHNIKVSNTKIKKVLVGYSKGVPRTLTEMFEFVLTNSFDDKTIIDFLGIIDEDVFINLFEFMRTGSMYDVSKYLTEILDSNSVPIFVNQFKDFMIRVMFLMEGDVREGFSPIEVSRIKAIFDGNKNFLKICGVVEKLDSSSENDLLFKVIKISQLVNGKELSNVFTDNSLNAVKQVATQKSLASQLNAAERQVRSEDTLTALDIDFLSSVGGEL